jgi:cupin 2 domain-containing protein
VALPGALPGSIQGAYVEEKRRHPAYTGEMRNLFGQVPRELPHELFEEIVSAADVRIERIVSAGHTTPAGEWYDQDWNEWVVVLQGRARLRVEGESAARKLGPGDHCFLPAHCRHRVDWTDPQAVTMWLAVHWPMSASSPSARQP